MQKIVALLAALMVTLSFSAAQIGGQPEETPSGQESTPSGSSTQPDDTVSEMADSAGDNSPDSAQDRAQQGKENGDQQGPPEGKKPSLPSQASATAKKVVDTVFSTVGNIGKALSSLFAGGK